MAYSKLFYEDELFHEDELFQGFEKDSKRRYKHTHLKIVLAIFKTSLSGRRINKPGNCGDANKG